MALVNIRNAEYLARLIILHKMNAVKCKEKYGQQQDSVCSDNQQGKGLTFVEPHQDNDQ